MFKLSKLMYLYCETALHAGAGRELGSIDLPIQREKVTNWPMVQAGGVKGKMRAIAETGRPTWLEEVFGPETTNASDHAGALAFSDARLLLFPVRALTGVFAYLICPSVLQRLRRELGWSQNENLPPTVQLQDPEIALVAPGSKLTLDIEGQTQVILEDVALMAKTNDQMTALGAWLSNNALPQTEEFTYWRGSLAGRLVMVSDSVFTDFATLSTEIQTHIKIEQDRKIVKDGMLWTAEYLPAESVLYVPLMAADSRKAGSGLDAAAIMRHVSDLKIRRMQLGGDETTGHGIVSVQLR